MTVKAYAATNANIGERMTPTATISATFVVLTWCAFTTANESHQRVSDVVSTREFRTTHKLKIGSKEIQYQSVAGEIFVEGENGKSKASVFSTSYFRMGVGKPSERPIVFLFNGGPGSTSVWLHIGGFGPKRLANVDAGMVPTGPPFKLEPNLETMLWYADLVFVDPVGSGYSHARGENSDQDFWGVDEDATSLAEFVRRYLTKHKRWESPKFLAGESYGTIRVCLLVRELHLKLLNNIVFNGVIFISSGTDVRVFLPPEPANELPYVTCIPTYAATAYYHKALRHRPSDFHQFIAEAQKFAATDYLTALFQGQALSKARRQAVAEQLAYYTGLDVEYLQRANLRIGQRQFIKELLRDRGQTLSIHDTRFVGRDADSAGEFVKYDPFLPATGGALATAVNYYLTKELGVSMPGPYNVFCMTANKEWKRATNANKVFSGYLNVTKYLEEAATNNPGFRVFVASGYHDLTTTFFGAKYAFNHIDMPANQLVLRNYDGGHMMYLHKPSRVRLSEDIADFIKSSGK